MEIHIWPNRQNHFIHNNNGEIYTYNTYYIICVCVWHLEITILFMLDYKSIVWINFTTPTESISIESSAIWQMRHKWERGMRKTPQIVCVREKQTSFISSRLIACVRCNQNHFDVVKLAQTTAIDEWFPLIKSLLIKLSTENEIQWN